MKKGIFFLLLIFNLKGMSQPIVNGEYFYRKMEMVAGFNFSPDGKFQFFYSYGAADRNATGTFEVKGDTLKLKSDKEAGKDFTITNQTKTGKGYSLTFEHPNNYLVNNILAVFFMGDKQQEAYTDDNGKLHVDIPYCDSIYVQHRLFPDILTLVKSKSNDNNTFKLSLNPSLEQVSFKGIDFKIESEKKITCLPNYFMEMDGIGFVKK